MPLILEGPVRRVKVEESVRHKLVVTCNTSNATAETLLYTI